MVLVDLLRGFRGHLAADFRRFYGCSLEAVLSGRVAGVREVAAWAVHLPPESATFRALYPHHQHTHDLELLRSVELSLRWLVWAKTKAATKNQDMPEPYRFPWEPEPDDGAFKGDPMTTDEADDWLGWADLKAG